MKLTVKLDFGGGNELRVGTFSEIARDTAFEFAGKPVAVEPAAGGAVVPAGARLYLKTALPRSEVEAAFKASAAR